MDDFSLQAYFAGAFREPCWFMRQGHGSTLMWNSGPPFLKVSERSRLEGDRLRLSSRMVIPKGPWRFVVFCCDWRIFGEGHLFAHNECSRDQIGQACAVLDGQILSDIRYHPESRRTSFLFDREGRLETAPYADGEESDQWTIHCSDGRAFALRSDGFYSFQPGNTPPAEKEWKPLTA